MDNKTGSEAYAKPALPTAEVVLLKSHTHEGKAKEKSDKISVDASTAEWLRKHGVIA